MLSIVTSKSKTYKFDLFIATYGPACIFYDRTITITVSSLALGAHKSMLFWDDTQGYV